MRILLCFIIMMAGTGIKAQPAWHQVKDKNNIKVYTSESDSSDIKHIKVTALFDGSLDKIKAIFLDIGKQKDWVYGTKQSYVLKETSEQDLLYYVETSLPWPLSNRDIAIDMKFDENKIDNTMVIRTVGVPSAIPVKKGIVRVPHFTGDWYFKETGNNKLSIEYYLFVDPGGSLPAWVVNIFISRGPYETFSKLSGLLNQ